MDGDGDYDGGDGCVPGRRTRYPDPCFRARHAASRSAPGAARERSLGPARTPPTIQPPSRDRVPRPPHRPDPARVPADATYRSRRIVTAR